MKSSTFYSENWSDISKFFMYWSKKLEVSASYLVDLSPWFCQQFQVVL